MSESYVVVDGENRPTTFVGPDATQLFRVRMIKSAIELHGKNGMLMTRGANITKVLAEATKITGKKYTGKTKHASAIADLDKWLTAMNSAIPIVQAER